MGSVLSNIPDAQAPKNQTVAETCVRRDKRSHPGLVFVDHTNGMPSYSFGNGAQFSVTLKMGKTPREHS